MKRLTFRGHIYLGLSVLIVILLISLLYLTLLFSQVDVSHFTLASIRTTFIVTAVLVFARPKRLLIIEDDQYFADILEAYAKEQGFETHVARQGDTGLQMAMDSSPHAIIPDIMLPVMDGYEAITEIRANKKLSELPVIAITAKAMKGDRQRVLDVGASDYIVKPIDVNKLLSLLRVG